MSHPRHSGILLHLTSLPGIHGSGDLGPSARHFVDWLVAARQSLWQILPLGGVGPGNSPYMSPSAFAGNELLIDLLDLRHMGLLSDADVAPDAAFSTSRVDFPAIKRYRMARLRLAAERFFAEAPGTARQAFEAFCAEAAEWLDDYALFQALDQRHGGWGKVWQDWPAPLVHRQAAALREARLALAEDIDFWRFCQWRFHVQWKALKDYANGHGVDLVGDVPIFVSAHSADVWAHQTLFDLDPDGHPRVVAGVPPDYFSATGQLWGNPLYRWPQHARQGYRWWLARLGNALDLCDIVRIDHFRGFESYWEVPADAETAVGGEWRPGPGAALFTALRKARGASNTLPIIAEDLGIITPEVSALREELGLPGMRILQFAFDGHSDNFYLPHNHERNSVIYTGTHDNDTTVGWWRSLAAHQQDEVRRYLGCSGEEIHWDLIRAASMSVCRYSIIPLQDVLGLDGAARMNRPGAPEGFWEWRFAWKQVEAWHAERLADLTRRHGRDAFGRPTRTPEAVA